MKQINGRQHVFRSIFALGSFWLVYLIFSALSASDKTVGKDVNQTEIAPIQKEALVKRWADPDGTDWGDMKVEEFDENDPEYRSLMTLSDTLASQAAQKGNLQNMLNSLRSQGQIPQVNSDGAQQTGEMTLVRTENPMPGTRYFHAQFFNDENEEPVLQHLSFEFRKGPKAIAMAKAALKKAFPNLGRPKNKGEFLEWQLVGGYILWVSTLTKNDIEGDPFNAYTKDDIGTVIVTVEEDPHGLGERFHQ